MKNIKREDNFINQLINNMDNFSLIELKEHFFYKNNFYKKIDIDFTIDRNKVILKNSNKSDNLFYRINPFLFKNKENEIIFIYGSSIALLMPENNHFELMNELKEKISHLYKEIKNGYSNNLLINSENYIALSLLNFLKKEINYNIKFISIDPPYNTGNKNMKYNDVFVNYYDENLKKEISSHENWFLFMKKRIELAYSLLEQDGFIFININEKELVNLKMLMNEIFGEENFIENFIWIKNSNKNNSKTTSTIHEYVLCYAKNKKHILKNKQEYFKIKKNGFEEINQLKNAIVNSEEFLNKTEEDKITFLEKELINFYKKNKNLKGISQYKKVEKINENYEIFRISDVSAPNKNGEFYDIIHPKTHKICKMPKGGYRYNQETINNIIENNLFYFGKDENTVPQFKRYLKDMETENQSSIIFNYDDGYNDLKQSLNEKELKNIDFNNPKPVSLIKQFIEMIFKYSQNNQKNIYCIDFFAGSGTIFESIKNFNNENKQELKVIGITNNENNICESITKNRLKNLKIDFIYVK